MVQRKKFSKEFKLGSVYMVLGRTVLIAQVARDLGINKNLINRWIREQSSRLVDAMRNDESVSDNCPHDVDLEAW
jgi:transposase